VVKYDPFDASENKKLVAIFNSKGTGNEEDVD